MPVVIVELLMKATRRLVQPEIRQAHWVERTEPAEPSLAAEERPPAATLRQALLARSAQQSDRLARAFFAQDRRP